MILKHLMLFAMMLSGIITINAQTSKITSFYGVKFGDSRSAIEAGIRTQGKTGEWKYSKSKKMDYYLVRDVELGSVKFSCSYKVVDFGDDSVVLLDVEGDKSKYSDYCQEKFEQMKYNLSSKYGEPITNTSEKCMWRSGNNQIILQNRAYTTYDNFKAFGSSISNPEYNYEVSVEYSSGNNTNTNF